MYENYRHAILFNVKLQAYILTSEWFMFKYFVK